MNDISFFVNEAFLSHYADDIALYSLKNTTSKPIRRIYE